MIRKDNISIWVITLSDRASRGEYEDLSGPAIEKLASGFFREKGIQAEVNKHLIPDDPNKLKELLEDAKGEEINLVFTTGGTGIGPRDFTPDVAKEIIEKEIPGIMEMIRVKYGMVKPNALVSRSVAGTMAKTLLYTLPGSVKAVSEYCSEILPTVLHSIKMLHGVDDHS